ncbi:hypothetical protein BY458DRAFT_432124 [Sporodiniella umbellata]|nr:hypothetical protein BY458DRAFT_432124 [Sporodiniella umbellata]
MELTYKKIEYQSTLYQIPIRTIENKKVILFSDVQNLLPAATALLHNSKLVSFELGLDLQELSPRRVLLSEFSIDTVWQAHVPREPQSVLTQTTIELQIKLDQLSEKVDRLLLLHSPNNVSYNTVTATSEASEAGTAASNSEIPTLDFEETHDANENSEDLARTRETTRSQSPPPAFLTPSASQEAPPSYEISVLSSIKLLNSMIKTYEAHINTRHKSPKWMSKRQEWLSREPENIEQVAFQLVQLEISLLWTAVSEAWYAERETWLMLVSTARSERHLAGAILNLERHTVVMNQEWPSVKESWVNSLLELIVLPLSHT